MDPRAKPQTAIRSDGNERVRAYWEASWMAASAARDEEYRYAMEPFIHQIAQFTRYRGRDVLEIGVGSGIDHLQWARAGARLRGVDLTEEAIVQTRARLAREGLTSDLQRVDAEGLPFPDESVDVVYSWGVIHHASHPERIVSEIQRVLRPGGLFLGMVYARRSAVSLKLWIKHALLAGQARRTLGDVLAEHMESQGTKGYTAAEVRRLFAGFGSVQTERFVTPYDRHALPGPLAASIPRTLGWFIAVRARK